MQVYAEFIHSKAQLSGRYGFAPNWLPDFLFDFQAHLVEWATRKGRAAILADCGLGKGPMQLVWAENVVRHTNRPVLILTPLSVASQMCAEGAKFGVDCHLSRDGRFPTGARVIVTNYEKLHHFRPVDFAGVSGDESSILKNFEGERKAQITEFLRMVPYRLLNTATAAPIATQIGLTFEELAYPDTWTAEDGSECAGELMQDNGQWKGVVKAVNGRELKKPVPEVWEQGKEPVR
jgi:hypothetical protein